MMGALSSPLGWWRQQYQFTSFPETADPTDGKATHFHHSFGKDHFPSLYIPKSFSEKRGNALRFSHRVTMITVEILSQAAEQ